MPCAKAGVAKDAPSSSAATATPKARIDFTEHPLDKSQTELVLTVAQEGAPQSALTERIQPFETRHWLESAVIGTDLTIGVANVRTGLLEAGSIRSKVSTVWPPASIVTGTR